jgi:hypothetical protein
VVGVAERLEIDGIPVWFAPRPGSGTTAGLVFRVGRADETLGSSGITHLAEHLALHPHGISDYHYNGAVDALTTQFVTHGSDDDVVGFLRGLAESFNNLPVDRIDAEKALLRTEAQSRRSGANVLLPLWRYGAQRYGLTSYPEWGLNRVSGDEVAQWARTRFVRGNAALWIAGERLPDDLALNLPAGPRREAPAGHSVLTHFPSFICGPTVGVVLDTLVSRGVAATMLTAVLERSLLRVLRHESAISYTVDTDYSPRGDDMATITILADATPDKMDVLLGTFGDTMKRIRAKGVDPQDVEAVRRTALEAMDHPDAEMSLLPGMAVSTIVGQPVLSLAERRAALEAVTIDEVNAVAMSLLDSALLQVPYGFSAEHLGFEPAPATSTAEISGQRYRSRGDGESILVVGENAVSLAVDEDRATVHFNLCAARLDFPDGARHYIGFDGTTVRLEPTVHSIGVSAVAEVRDRLPTERIIPMPSRSPDEIPGPHHSTDRQHDRRRSRRRKIEAMILPLVTAALIWTFVTEANAWKPSDGSLNEKIILGTFFLACAVALRTFFLYVRRVQRRQW